MHYFSHINLYDKPYQFIISNSHCNKFSWILTYKSVNISNVYKYEMKLYKIFSKILHYFLCGRLQILWRWYPCHKRGEVLLMGVTKMAAEMNQMKMHLFVRDIISQDVLLEGLSVQWRISVSAMNMSVMGSFIAEKIWLMRTLMCVTNGSAQRVL